jgi:hypothetical protein
MPFLPKATSSKSSDFNGHDSSNCLYFDGKKGDNHLPKQQIL